MLNRLNGYIVLLLAIIFGEASADMFLKFSVDDGATFGDSLDINTGRIAVIGIHLSETAPDTA